MNAPDQMERSRAARAILKDSRGHDLRDQAEEEMDAFMAIFHPEIKKDGRWTDEPKP